MSTSFTAIEYNMIRAEEENELFLKASLFMFQCFLSLLISLSD